MPRKRKSLSLKIRFEVFKRDSFTCQYCGMRAPDVVLNVDHIMPHSKGGSDDIMNLVTSCHMCNSGKSDRILSDDAVVKKSQKQAEFQQERKNQVKMIAKWHMSLPVNNDEVKAVDDYLHKLTGHRLIDPDKKCVRSYLRKYGLDRVLKCLAITCDKYQIGDVVKKLKGVCYYDFLEESDPDESRLCKAFYKLKANWYASNACWRTKDLMRRARDLGWTIDVQVVDGLRYCRSFSSFNEYLETLIDSEKITGGL